MARVPASIRNNNPGAMYPGPSAKVFGSTSFETLRSKDGVHKIATFHNPESGAAAMFDLLHTRYTGTTIEGAIKKWCGGFYVGTYIKVLEEKGGVSRSDVLTKDMVKDPAVAIPLCQAMAWQEAGREFPMTHEQWHDAHQMWRETLEGWSPENGNPSPFPEQVAAERTKQAIGPLAGVGAIGGGLVAAPDLSGVVAWKAAGETAASVGTWALSHWWIAAGLAVIGLVIYAARRGDA